ncbi:MAG: hypothetical protein HY587_04240 [Candidatus Omnitrophica bacterium]|nr:hypothetical protein [Candidatus Omnitrophota bacterium]
MLKNKTKWNTFQRKLLKKERFSYREALRVYEALHKEAVALGIINSRNLLDGLEVDIRLAKALNRLAA